ncbi:MAG: hypothetical protein HFE67_08050 [Erysipelotrichaceae bacterium]|nr:hypothetical protein [Erysipelotrichaceae bacterium]
MGKQHIHKPLEIYYNEITDDRMTVCEWGRIEVRSDDNESGKDTSDSTCIA